MKKGDTVYLKMNWGGPGGPFEYHVYITAVAGNTIEGNFVATTSGRDAKDGPHGGFPFGQILESRILKSRPVYKDGDEVKGVHYSYKRFEGKWYAATKFTDETIEKTKNSGGEPGGMFINKSGPLSDLKTTPHPADKFRG